ncbi:MAG: hypothetical protein JOY62_00265 [Acidobacteriaceae bacterium]|nr:hypothetical protein [Acidobacteriaceae bacterium]MBV9778377.1 hypothetical protein [Acidobacteriaceae bacterium]
MRLEESGFYLLEAPKTERCLCKYARDGVVVREEIRCSLVPGHARIGRFFSDLNVTIPCAPAADVLFTWGSECLIQGNTLAVMKAERLTGFWTKPAKAALKKTGEQIPVYQLGITGWAGIIPAESGVRLREYCPECQFSNWSDLANPDALIDPQNWDGSDFFMIWPLPAFIFVTERVVQVFKDAGLKGAEFVKTFPSLPRGAGLSPQRLSYFMPPDRAHEIGDPLGIY